MSRSLGTEPTSCFWLEIPWNAHPADPNGYYALLHITKHPALMGEIRRAYLVRAREVHPDTGGEPNPDLFERIYTAYTVLSNPETRRIYDALGPDERYLDWRQERELYDRAVRRINDEIDEDLRPEAVRMLRASMEEQALKERESPPLDLVTSPDDFLFYYDDHMSIPPQEIRHEWIYTFARALWYAGFLGNFKVGFTHVDHEVLLKEWGVLFMVNAGKEDPNDFLASHMVKLAAEALHSDPGMARIRVVPSGL